MQKFKVKIIVRSTADTAEFLSTEMEVLSNDIIDAFKPFQATAKKMQPRADDDAK